ncbi:DUF2330 domain-containing protein [Nocardia sp. CA-107356]|uniref:DUF2330 domain-containing protein n=1 Tax=Nocardia sp. CA-107356 TaxID=3239972 RepID=UPI003D8AF373
MRSTLLFRTVSARRADGLVEYCTGRVPILDCPADAPALLREFIDQECSGGGVRGAVGVKGARQQLGTVSLPEPAANIYWIRITRSTPDSGYSRWPPEVGAAVRARRGRVQRLSALGTESGALCLTCGCTAANPSRLAAMRASLAVRLLAVAGMLFATAGIGALAPASACACGGVANPPGHPASVREETALVSWDGHRETVLMRLALKSGTDQAALIVPTPKPATVAGGDAATFAELRNLTAPRIVTERRWFPSLSGDSAGESAMSASGGGPTVLDRVQLGPLEATTLSGGDLDGIRKWLSDNGYEMRPEVISTLEPYLREGWSFVAMRLTSARALDGAMDPVRLSFDSDRFVYPMRMSSAAQQAQYVHLYALGEHRLRRTDPDATAQTVRVDFAGRVRATDPELAQLAASGRNYLTELRVSIDRPADIRSDFAFAADATDAQVYQTTHRSEDVELFGLPAGVVILGAVFLAAIVVVFAIVRVLRA